MHVNLKFELKSRWLVLELTEEQRKMVREIESKIAYSPGKFRISSISPSTYDAFMLALWYKSKGDIEGFERWARISGLLNRYHRTNRPVSDLPENPDWVNIIGIVPKL